MWTEYPSHPCPQDQGKFTPQVHASMLVCVWRSLGEGKPAPHLHGNELVRIRTLRWHVYTFSRRQQCSSGYQNGYNQLSSERKCLHASLAGITLHQKAPRGLLLQRWLGPCRILRRISMVLFLISPVIGVSTNPLGIFFFYFCVMNSLYGFWKLLF